MELVKNNIEEEIFCLNYELSSLSELLIYGHAERWIYKRMLPIIENEHLERYIYASKFIENKTVLEIASGCGYGSYYLSNHGNPLLIDAADIDENAVRYSKHKYSAHNINRFVGDAEIYMKENFYDVIISFETIEHLNNVENYLTNVLRSLKKDGLFIVSTPINKSTTSIDINPYHTIEWSFKDFQNLFIKNFHLKEINVQSIFLESDFSFYRIKKLIRKIFKKPNIQRPIFEKYLGQYNSEKICKGYQVLLLQKK